MTRPDRPKRSNTTQRSVTHGSFTLHRSLPVPPERAFAAFSDPVQKRKWFAESANSRTSEYMLDCRDGGSEIWRGHMGDSPEIVFRASYADVRAPERIVMTYQMWIGGEHISVYLQCIELRHSPFGCDLILTEHGAHLDGGDSPAMRQQGTEELLDALERSLTA